MTGVPSWSAARSGLLGDPGAVDASAQVNQLLGTHPGDQVYVGSRILTPNGQGVTGWTFPLATQDVDQPFTMSGTAIGRVQVPLLPVGTGADLIVSLYTDSAGAPGTLVNRARIPASWITQLAAVSGVAGPSSQTPVLQYTNSALATAQSNILRIAAPFTSTPFVPAANTPTGTSYVPSVAVADNWMINATGLTGFTDAVSAMQWAGGSTLAAPVLEPSLPVATENGGVVVTPDTVVVAGGGVSGVGPTTNVWTASWDPVTGQIGAWSAQAPLPVAATNGENMAASGQTVYVVNSNGPDVYYATLQNGQIASWGTAPPLPYANTTTAVGYLAVVGSFLVAAGAYDYSVPAYSGSSWYAPINADGSLGGWQACPPMPDGASTSPCGANTLLTSYGMVAFGGYDGTSFSPIQSLSFGAYGPGMWLSQQPGAGASGVSGVNNLCAAFEVSDGTWQVLCVATLTTVYASQMLLTPYISVPLPATGLTNGATYHLVLEQAGGGESDYLVTTADLDVFPGNPTLLTRGAGSTSWAAGTTGYAVPLTIYDNSNGIATPGQANNQVVHTWEDSGARMTTLVRATTPDRRMLGICEATAQPGPVLNQTPTFTTGLGQWRATGGTVAQSSAFTHGSLPYSMLLTPSGSAVQAYAESDLVAVHPGHEYVLNAWLYSPTGYSNVAVSANWFDASRTYLSTTSGTATAISAGAWTLYQTTVTADVANGVYVDLVAVEGGTPPSTALLYTSSATVQDASGPQLALVGAYEWPGTWPGSGLWPPLGFTVLA